MCGTATEIYLSCHVALALRHGCFFLSVRLIADLCATAVFKYCTFMSGLHVSARQCRGTFTQPGLPRKLYEGPCPIDFPQLCTVHLAQGGATAMHKTVAIARLNFPVDWFKNFLVVNLSSNLECHDQLNYYTDCAPLSSRRSFPDHIVGRSGHMVQLEFKTRRH
ncbi:hypothetical protein DFH09DRAFT_1070624 [Mycena vulgaris]|nr:hypothetical protein DFH09DRAFT_1070624 [Mycena vulgaris]